MIIIRNRQRKIAVDIDALRADAQTILNTLGYADFDLGVLITSQSTIRTYNREYRHKDKATDILSFPFYPSLRPGEKIKAQEPDDKNLGDLIISPGYVMHDLPQWGVSFARRMQVLLVHGICHLLGYDHILDDDYKVMKRKENALLRLLPVRQ